MALVESKQLPMGWGAIDFNLKGTDGNTYSLENFKEKKGLLIIFTCNHCPYAKEAWPTTIELGKAFGNDIGFIAINANNQEEYPDDSFEEMKKKVTEWGIPFPYVEDTEQKTARAYQAQCTPDLYLFKNDNKKFKLFYHGRAANDLENALEKLVGNESAPETQPPSEGCSIKWK
jgi:thiol-disulfide isomerase/thioredoxin